MLRLIWISLMHFIVFNAWGQQRSEFSISIIGLRYAPVVGAHIYTSYGSQLQTAPGLLLHFTASEKKQVVLGSHFYQKNVRAQGGLASDRSQSRGVEIFTGLEYFFNQKRKVYLSASALVFYEYSRIRGFFQQDHPPLYRVDHARTYFGLGGCLQLNFDITLKITLLVSTRIRYGFNYINRVPDQVTATDYLSDGSSSRLVIDPLNGLSLRYHFL